MRILFINDTLIKDDDSAVSLKFMEDGRPVLFISPVLCQQGQPTALDPPDPDETETWQVSIMRELAWKSAVDCHKFPLTAADYELLGWVPIKAEQAAELCALKCKNDQLYCAYEEASTPEQAWARCGEDGEYLNSFGQPATEASEIAFVTVEQMSRQAEVNPCGKHFFAPEEEIVEALCTFRQGSNIRAIQPRNDSQNGIARA